MVPLDGCGSQLSAVSTSKGIPRKLHELKSHVDFRVNKKKDEKNIESD